MAHVHQDARLCGPASHVARLWSLWQPLGRFFLLAAGYFVMAQLGLRLAPPELAISLIWLPTGIATAALFRWGVHYWPAVTFTTIILQEFSFAVPWPLAGMIVGGQTLAPVLVVLLLRWFRFHPEFDRRRDIGLFCLATASGMLASATGGVTCLAIAGKAAENELARAWLTWWLGDCMGVLAAAPLLVSITWQNWKSLRSQYGEFLIWCAVAAGMFGVIFFTPAQPGVGTLSLVFLPLALTAWAALRFGVSGTSFAVLALAVAAAAGTAAGCGPFLKPDRYSGVFLLWSYIGSVAVLSFVIMGIEVGRKAARESLLQSKNELEAVNAQLRAAAAQAEALARSAAQTDAAKSNFLARVSHEIRTPMNGVIGMIDLLLAGPLSPDQRDYAEVIRSSSEALLQLVNEILDLSKIEAGKIELESLDFNLAEVFHDISVLFRQQAEGKHLAFACRIMPETPVLLRGDCGRLRQILVNLAGNAIKFTERGEVTLSARQEAKDDGKVLLRFEITDTGIGIPESRLADLFKPFVQIDISTSRKFGGSGLGLAISRQLVELMGGKIGARNEEKGGTTFWVILPFHMQAVEAASSGHTRPVLPASSMPASNRRLLLVEDNPMNQQVFRLQLQRLGYPVDIVSHGREALEALASVTYDLVLMDCEMPELDGYETARIIRSHESPVLNAKIPIIALTAHAMPDNEKKCLDAGMDGYLTKPIRPADLAAMLERWLPPS